MSRHGTAPPVRLHAHAVKATLPANKGTEPVFVQKCLCCFTLKNSVVEMIRIELFDKPSVHGNMFDIQNRQGCCTIGSKK